MTTKLSTRAEHILEQVRYLDEATDITPYIVFPAMSLISTGANVGVQRWQAQQQLTQKVQQGGHGKEYQHAKEKLSDLRTQRYLRPHTPQTHKDLKRKIAAQKRLIQDIEHSALAKFQRAQLRSDL